MDFFAHSVPSKDKSVWQLLREHLLGTAERAARNASAFGGAPMAWTMGAAQSASI